MGIWIWGHRTKRTVCLSTRKAKAVLAVKGGLEAASASSFGKTAY
ncbi:hypothetical protein COLO4_36462 [Corchorus olitorius]|uniref:Uncharacterized protein n=1 Tax=Corchorus olitorius TaxID=93759 RepID=A0A1R3G8U2_9ROSI|nr:hypothetical protein COLO4_36462 [Corchorus olitorius]